MLAAIFISVLITNIVYFISSTLAVLILLLLLVSMSYLFYRYYQKHLIIGTCIFTLGIVLILIAPAALTFIGEGGLVGMFASITVAIMLAIIFTPIGLILIWIGFRLINQGWQKLEIESKKSDKREETITSPDVAKLQFCTNCGAKILADTKYCIKCGKKL